MGSTDLISTQFFVCVKNMSRCVNYREGVGVGFCQSGHSVKIRQMHLGVLSRGPSHNVPTHTSLVSDYTCQWGPSVK